MPGDDVEKLFKRELDSLTTRLEKSDCKACKDGPLRILKTSATPRPDTTASSLDDTPGQVPSPKCYAYMDSGCPLNRREVGRATWGFLHTMAAYYPTKPTRTEQKDMRQFMYLMSKVYPCGYCADMTVAEMNRNPPRVDSQDVLAKYMCELHNEVNDRLGKPLFECTTENLNERWKTGPADGSCG
eukprot:4785_1